MVDYELHWGITSKQINYTNKVVLDLGADNGSTAEFFLTHGAKHVIAVEGNQKLAGELIAKYRGSSIITPIYMFLCEKSDVEYLISEYHPDIVKVDIEGEEILLIDTNPKIVSSIKEWVLKVHSDILNEKLQDFFKRLDYKHEIIPYLCSKKEWVHYWKSKI